MNYLMMLSIASFFYILILQIIFLLKKKINNSETKIYSVLIIIIIIEIFFEISMRIIAPYMDTLSFLNIFIAKLFSCLSLTWFSLITLYNINISFYKDNFLYYKKLFRYLIIFLSLSVIFVFSFPIEFYFPANTNYYTYVYGPSISIAFFQFFILMVVNIFIIIKNGKSKFSKKYVPIILSILFFTVGGILQKINPSFLINVFGQSLVTFLMYHTIENPDMKLLEEAHKSKEISDTANEEKTIFLYNMTQEIRGITGKIDDDADVILDSKDYDEIYDNARDIKANTAKFTNITNDILDVSNVDSSTIKVYTEKYNIKNMLKQLVSVYGELCKNKNLKFVTNIDHNIPEVLYGDSIGLKEILNVILKNSVKYTNKGFVELDVNTVIKNDICRLIITVEDSGIGIKSEDINNLKVSNTSLAKANKLATMMNGALLLSSDYGIGTKIKIILDQKMDTDVDSEVSKYESVFENINILSVDDSEAGHKIIDKLLKGTNIKLDIVTTGKECLDKLKVNKYNLILLDEELEEMTGIELMKKMKETRNFKIPVIFLTKNNSYEYNEEYVKAGFSDYLLKPLKKEELINKINMYTKKDKK